MTDVVGRYREEVARLLQAVLKTAGDTTTSLRRAVAACAAALGGAATAPSNETLPPSVHRYVSTVALHAYKVTDGDVDALKDANLSEDAIFEITMSAALGAALSRLDRGLGALQEATGYETQSR